MFFGTKPAENNPVIQSVSPEGHNRAGKDGQAIFEVRQRWNQIDSMPGIDITDFILHWGSPQPPSGSMILQKDSQNSELLFYSQLLFIPVKGSRLKLAKIKDTLGRVQERPGVNL